MLQNKIEKSKNYIDIIVNRIGEILQKKPYAIIAIDGRCAAGKTTLANNLKAKINERLSQEEYIADKYGEKYNIEKPKDKGVVNLFHMDDFFLRPEQRTAKRLEVPGENVDHERFLEEVLMPLMGIMQNEATNNTVFKDRKDFSYRRYDCSTQDLQEEIIVEPKKVAIIEGSYSCHNSLWKYYDLRIFMDVDSHTQIERIKRRNGEERAENFKNIWIPLEEKYFETFDIRKRCEIKLKL